MITTRLGSTGRTISSRRRRAIAGVGAAALLLAVAACGSGNQAAPISADATTSANAAPVSGTTPASTALRSSTPPSSILPSSTESSPAGATSGLKPIDQAALQLLVDTTIKEQLIPGAVLVLSTPQGDFTVSSGTTEIGVQSRVCPEFS